MNAYDNQQRDTVIAGTWSNDLNNLQFVVGITIGGSSATSANDTYEDNGVFETGDLRLDYACTNIVKKMQAAINNDLDETKIKEIK